MINFPLPLSVLAELSKTKNLYNWAYRRRLPNLSGEPRIVQPKIRTYVENGKRWVSAEEINRLIAEKKIEDFTA